MSVLILYNIPRSVDEPSCAWAESDEGVMVEVRSVQEALSKRGTPHRAVGIRRLSDLRDVLGQAPEAVVFNLVEGLRGGAADMNLVPAVCRAFGKGCTGNDTACLTLALDKWHTKAALQARGLPVPRAAIVPVGARPGQVLLPEGPLIVKPVAADGSEGIEADSVVDGAGEAVWRVVRRVHERFGQPAIVEQFLTGRELNASTLQRDGSPQALPLAEIDFSAFPEGKPKIVDYAAKWRSDTFEYNHTPPVIPAPLEEALAVEVRRLALGAWEALGCQDYARVDFRLDDRNRPFILEVNPNPDISPDAGFAAALTAAEIPYDEFVDAVVRSALQRAAKQA